MSRLGLSGFPRSARAAAGGAASPDTANGADFDGTNDYLSISTLTGAADGKTGLFSCWVNTSSLATLQVLYIKHTGEFSISISGTSGRFRIEGRNSGGTKILDLYPTKALTINTWHHIAASWDLATGATHVFLDRVELDVSGDQADNDTIDYTDIVAYYVGSSSPFTAKTAACLGEFYFAQEYLDLSTVSNLNKFIDTNGSRVSLGSTGATPTGTQPIIYLSGDSTQFEDNFGSGGAFTVVGSLANCVLGDVSLLNLPIFHRHYQSMRAA